MGRLFNKAKQIVDIGRSDSILSIPTELPKLDNYIYGTRQGCYYLYGAESGVGKTTFVRETHMHKVYEECVRVNDPTKLDVLFIDFSLEITAELNVLSAITRKAYTEYNKVLPVEKLAGWKKRDTGVLTEEDYKIFCSYEDFTNDFEKKLVVVDEETTPTLFHDVLMEAAKRNGTFSKEGRWISDCGTYTPKNKQLYVIVIVDTVNLADMDPQHDTVKSAIDRISRIGVWFRNKCNFTPIIIQQFNADISSTDRSRFGITTPQLRDFEDSKRTTKDANVVLGLYDPLRHLKEDNTIFKGYDIARLKSWFRSAHILKNRNGEVNKFVPMKFSGPVGIFEQLGVARDMSDADYELATKLN